MLLQEHGREGCYLIWLLSLNIINRFLIADWTFNAQPSGIRLPHQYPGHWKLSFSSADAGRKIPVATERTFFVIFLSTFTPRVGQCQGQISVSHWCKPEMPRAVRCLGMESWVSGPTRLHGASVSSVSLRLAFEKRCSLSSSSSKTAESWCLESCSASKRVPFTGALRANGWFPSCVWCGV